MHKISSELYIYDSENINNIFMFGASHYGIGKSHTSLGNLDLALIHYESSYKLLGELV